MNRTSEAPSTHCSPHRVQRLLEQARAGQPEPLGELLQAYRNYLQLLATTQIDRKLKARLSASDLVQETLMAAYRDFPQFQGSDEKQLLAWLRQILIHRLHAYVRQHVLADKRNVRRERSLDAIQRPGDRSATWLRAAAVDPASSPSARLIRRENAAWLADQLARMSPSLRDVIVLRNLEGLAFDEIGQRMNRSSGAARMLWLRAIRQLQHGLDETS